MNSVIFDNEDTNIYEIENYWTKENINSNDNEFNYELEENNCLAKKKDGNKHTIKSKLKLKEGNTYILLFSIIYENDDKDFVIGFGNFEKKKGIYLSSKGLFINEINTNEKIKIENNDEICFILVLKKEKFFIVFKNGKYRGKFSFDLTDIYALASIEETDDSVKLRTFIKL